MVVAFAAVEAGPVVVRGDADEVRLGPEDQVLFGRGEDCAIRVAHAPQDAWVSRHAGMLRLVDDTVQVRNLSATQPFLLVSRSAPQRVVDPGTETVFRHRRFDIVLIGACGCTYSLHVDASALGPYPSYTVPAQFRR